MHSNFGVYLNEKEMIIKHALKNLLFGQIDRYNSINVEFVLKNSKIQVVKNMTSTCTMSNRKGEQIIYIN